MSSIKLKCLSFLVMIAGYHKAKSQVLTMEEALQTAIANYRTIQAKQNYLGASRANEKYSRREALPNFTLAAQQDYGTVNGQNGPLYGFGGLGVASSGLPLPKQNWNAAFGALYLANFNWDFFAFGRVRKRIEVATKEVEREEKDYQQELFQHQVRVAGA